MKKLPLFPPSMQQPVHALLDLAPTPNAALRVGSVRLEPNQRVPESGLSCHEADEVSLILGGSLSGASGDAEFTVSAGDVTLIPAGEEHWAVAGPEGAEIFWLWFGSFAERVED